MKKRYPTILPATPEEERLIAELTAESVFDRLDRGEARIVDFDDWDAVPELPPSATLALPATLYQRLRSAGKRRRTTPEKLAARLVEKGLSAK